MKLLTRIIAWLLILGGSIFSLQSPSLAQSKWARNPVDTLLNTMTEVRETDAYRDKIQETALDDTNPTGQYATEYRITNMIDSIRAKIKPYIQRVLYGWLTLAVIGIIYNGFILVINPLTKPLWAEEKSKVKNRIKNIVLGVFILVWFYVIIEMLLAFITFVFG